MAKQEILFGFHNMTFKKFELDVANKKALSTQSLSLYKLEFPIKKAYFFKTAKFCIPGCYTINMFIFCCVEKSMHRKLYETGSNNKSTWVF